MNDLFDLGTEGAVIGFSDDKAIFYTDNDWKKLKEKTEKMCAKSSLGMNQEFSQLVLRKPSTFYSPSILKYFPCYDKLILSIQNY